MKHISITGYFQVPDTMFSVYNTNTIPFRQWIWSGVIGGDIRLMYTKFHKRH